MMAITEADIESARARGYLMGKAAAEKLAAVEIRELRQQLEVAQAEIERVREALRPFAVVGLKCRDPQDTSYVLVDVGVLQGRVPKAERVTAADLRRAAELAKEAGSDD